MSYTYTSYVSALASALVVQSSDTDFVGILPSAIDYAEQRIYRELDLLATVTTDSSANATANSRSFTLPQHFVRVDEVVVITPVSASPSTGTRNPLVPASKEYLDMVWPSDTAASATTVPRFFAMVTDQSIRFGPPPGAAFNVEIRGTTRPAPLSVSNATTVLTLYLPDLFFAASMVFLSGWQKNFGSQADDPRMAQSWETQTQALMATAKTEEMKKKLIGIAIGEAA